MRSYCTHKYVSQGSKFYTTRHLSFHGDKKLQTCIYAMKVPLKERTFSLFDEITDRLLIVMPVDIVSLISGLLLIIYKLTLILLNFLNGPVYFPFLELSILTVENLK